MRFAPRACGRSSHPRADCRGRAAPVARRPEDVDAHAVHRKSRHVDDVSGAQVTLRLFALEPLEPLNGAGRKLRGLLSVRHAEEAEHVVEHLERRSIFPFAARWRIHGCGLGEVLRQGCCIPPRSIRRGILRIVEPREPHLSHDDVIEDRTAVIEAADMVVVLVRADDHVEPRLVALAAGMRRQRVLHVPRDLLKAGDRLSPLRKEPQSISIRLVCGPRRRSRGSSRRAR